MTPDELSARLATLTTAVNSLDQDVQDLQALRRGDAQIVRAVASDLGEVKATLAQHGAMLGELGRGVGAITTMLQALIERETPDTSAS